MSACRLYIIDTQSVLSLEVIQNIYGIHNNVDELYKQYVDRYIKTAKLLGNKEIFPPLAIQSLYQKWAEQDANRCSVERLSNVWASKDDQLTIDSISNKAISLSRKLTRIRQKSKPVYVMYVTWEPKTKLVVAVFAGGHLVFMHVSDKNAALHREHQCNAQQLCMILEKILCPDAYAYCNERGPLQALYLFSRLLGFCPV